MVRIEGTKIKKLDDNISKKVKIGNDKRQFIIRIPQNIAEKSILTDFNKKYIGEVKINLNKISQLIINLSEDGKNT